MSQPLNNALGFGAGDFLLLVIMTLLGACLLLRPFAEPAFRTLSQKPVYAMLVLALTPVLLRLALLPNHPVPTPSIYDEFGHLLVADTIRHLRLANPAVPYPKFFETFFVLQTPTRSSIYPIGQGLALALGRVVLGHEWAGVLLSIGCFCALSYWALRAWTSDFWALAGGVLAIIEFGPLNEWTNTYWGGAVGAIAGCLVFGSLPRLTASSRTRDALFLGTGLGLQLITRPFESLLLDVSVLLFFVPLLRHVAQLQHRAKALAALSGPILLALGLTLVHNWSVTGSWKTLPYALSRRQYGVPTTFTFQPNPRPSRALTPQQELEYKAQRSIHGERQETLQAYLLRLEYRVRFYRFYFFPALYLALVAFLVSIRDFRFLWVVATGLIFSLGTNFYPFFYPHYISVLTCLFLLMPVVGLERLSAATIRGVLVGRRAAGLLLFLCGVHFVFWYSLHLIEMTGLRVPLMRFETWDTINHSNPERRVNVNRQLAEASGKQLVFVRYWPRHIYQDEWVYNAADLNDARVVWVRDLGPTENSKLLHYFPDRKVWLLQPDASPPILTPYGSNGSGAFQSVP